MADAKVPVPLWAQVKYLEDKLPNQNYVLTREDEEAKRWQREAERLKREIDGLKENQVGYVVEIDRLKSRSEMLLSERNSALDHLYNIAKVLGLTEESQSFTWEELADRASALKAENKLLRSNEGRVGKVENQAIEIRRLEADRTRLKDELEELQDIKGDYGVLRRELNSTAEARVRAEAKLDRIRQAVNQPVVRGTYPGEYAGKVVIDILNILNDDGGRT